jgi:Bcr/CflA subfamily drug resistance transporter
MPTLQKLQNNLTVRFWVIMLMTPYIGICIDLYVPSLPAISHFFHTTPRLAQMTVPAFMLGYGITNFIIGPVSDSIGRKKILVFGLFFCALIPALTLLSPNITTLLIARFCQGIAMAAPAGLVRTLMSDSYAGKDLKIVANYSTTVWALGPILAPAIGGYLQMFFGWKASFLCFTAYGLVLLVICLVLLPETNKNQHPLDYKTKKHDIKDMLCNSTFRAFMALMISAYGLLVIFNVLGPFLVQHHLGYSAVVYGHMAMILGIGWLLGSISNRLLALQYSSKQCLTIGSFCIGIMIIIFWIVALTLPLNLWTLIIPSLFLFAAASICFTNTFVFILNLYPKRTGTASSLYGSSMVIGIAILTFFAGFTHLNSQFPMLWIDTVFAITIMGSIVFAMRRVD